MYATISTQSHSHCFQPATKEASRTYLYQQDIYLDKNTTQSLVCFQEDVYLHPKAGITLIFFCNPSNEGLDQWMLDQDIVIPAGTYFNTLPISEKSQVCLATQRPAEPRVQRLTQEIHSRPLQKLPQIQRILSLAHYKRLKNPFVQFQVLFNYQALVVHSGHLDFQLNNSHRSLAMQEAILIHPQQVLEIKDNREANYTVIDFEADHIPTITQEMIFSISLTLSKELQGMTHQNTYQMIAGLYQLLDDSMNPREPQISPATKSNEKLLSQILGYLEDRLYDNLEVNDLVERFDVSRSTLQNMFQTHLQMTPLQYINKSRMEKSAELMASTDMSISEIAERLGFGSLQYFSRRFRNYFGESPTAYQKNYLEDK